MRFGACWIDKIMLSDFFFTALRGYTELYTVVIFLFLHMEHVDIRLPHSLKFSARITGSVNRIFFEIKDK
jgi:hypothetical protein